MLSCGSVRHNQRLQLEITDCEAKWRHAQRRHIQWMIKEAECQAVGDSLQQVIWQKEETIDSLELKLRYINYKFTYRREKDW